MPTCRSAALVALTVLVSVAAVARVTRNPPPREFTFEVRTPDAEVTLTITASCRRCDWSVRGREAVALKVELDGAYSQHVLITRGSDSAEYAVLLGPLAVATHKVRISVDTTVSAPDAGEVEISRLSAESTDRDSRYYEWMSRAPVLHARPGTLERYSDVPLASYVESLDDDAGYRYTVVFSHEDGGTPTDRLMATWGRTTDIEFVVESTRDANGTLKDVYQGKDHEILPFLGARRGSHPLLWVSTDNNMVSDVGPAGAIRFVPAPRMLRLRDVSREVFLDANPWLYAVMTAELLREGRIDPHARPGSGKIPHPRRFAYVEACGELRDATLAFDVAVHSGGPAAWHATDRGDPRFRIARSGCFRAAVPVPEGTKASDIRGLRARAYTRPPRRGEQPLPAGAGTVTLRRVNTLFMLDETFTPQPSGAKWIGDRAVPVDGAAVEIPIR